MRLGGADTQYDFHDQLRVMPCPCNPTTRLAVQARLAEENRQCFNELGGHVLQRLERMLEHGQVPQTKNVVPTPTLPAPKLRVMVEDATSHSSRGQSSQTDNMTTTVDSD